QQFSYAWEEGGVAGHTPLVLRQEFIAYGFIFRVIRRHAQAGPEQPARAVRGILAVVLQRQICQPAPAAQHIGCRAEVGGGIGQRAVEVEENELSHPPTPPCGSRADSSPRYRRTGNRSGRSEERRVGKECRSRGWPCD